MSQTMQPSSAASLARRRASQYSFFLQHQLFRPAFFPSPHFFSSLGPVRAKLRSKAAKAAQAAQLSKPTPARIPAPHARAKAASSPPSPLANVATKIAHPQPGATARVARPRSPLAAAAEAAAAAATSSAAVTAASAGGAVRTFAEQLGRKAVPTLLYEAPSHFWYRVTGLLAGSFCIGYTIVNYWQIYLKPPPDLVWWVPHAFAVICLVMTSLGVYFILGGTKVVRAIRAVPLAQLNALAGPSTAAKAVAGAAAKAAGRAGVQATHATAAAEPPILLEVEIGRVMPLLPARKLYVPPTAVALPHRLASFGLCGVDATQSGLGGSSAAPATGYERVLARRAEEERRQKEREYEMSHLMTAPFRHAWQGFRVAIKGMSRAFSRDGFVQIEVDGQKNYKFDVSGGWALENGRALDRLVTIKEGTF